MIKTHLSDDEDDACESGHQSKTTSQTLACENVTNALPTVQ